ncbi:hypothetical protein GQ44DRAFT_706771 [Phaeosphaeriaceae sp. PMI808]|nr:hypothetical protein GQ44DRAFT_706771 [Phaeosphaeriaceae sp. PMI808]
MKLPAELRNMIYNHVLADPSGIHLAAAFKKRRRTVERVSVELESHCAQPHYCDPLKAADNIRNQLEEPTVLLPALLAVSKQTYFEGRQILYSNEFTFTDSHALYCFLINLGPTGAKQLKSLRLKNWGYGRTLKTYNHACFAVLNWATELEAFRIDTTYRDTSNPKLAADQLYRDAFSWLEAFGMAKGKFDAGVDVLQLQSNCAVSHADNEEQFFESLRELLRIRQQTIMGKTGGQMKRKKTVKEVDV